MSTKTECAGNRAFRQDMSCARRWVQHSSSGAAPTVQHKCCGAMQDIGNNGLKSAVV